MKKLGWLAIVLLGCTTVVYAFSEKQPNEELVELLQIEESLLQESNERDIRYQLLDPAIAKQIKDQTSSLKRKIEAKPAATPIPKKDPVKEMFKHVQDVKESKEILISGKPYWTSESTVTQRRDVTSDWPLESQAHKIKRQPVGVVAKTVMHSESTEIPKAPLPLKEKEPFFLKMIKKKPLEQDGLKIADFGKSAAGDIRNLNFLPIEEKLAETETATEKSTSAKKIKEIVENSKTGDTKKPVVKTTNELVEKSLAEPLVEAETETNKNKISAKPASTVITKKAETTGIPHPSNQASNVPTPNAQSAKKEVPPTYLLKYDPISNRQFFDANGYADKSQSPTLKEIIKDGAVYGSSRTMFVEPIFLGNDGITVNGARSFSEPIDFGFEPAFQYNVGFESKQGPGFNLNYFALDANSDDLNVFSDGTNTVATSVDLIGAGLTSSLSTSVAGESVNLVSDLEIHRVGADFFKDIKMPRSRLRGIVGFEYISINQGLRAQVMNGGSVTDSLFSRMDLRAFGTKIGAEYRRPIGHTKIEMIGALSATTFFGHRDHVVSNSQTGDFVSLGGDELLANFNSQIGAQWTNKVTDITRTFVRVSVYTDIWLGGGSATNPSGDLGLYGIMFGMGLNH